jgi:hypothetical protein
MRHLVALLIAAFAIAPARGQVTAAYDDFGAGCPRGLTAYEVFSAAHAFDLSAQSLCFIPNGGNFYVVVGPGFDNGYANAVPLGNDAHQTFTFPGTGFPFGGRTFAQGAMVSNGFVWLGPAPASGADAPNPNAADLVGRAPRIAPFWADLDPTLGGQCYLDIDHGAFPRVMITWLAVPLAGTPSATVSAQIVLEESGVITINYLACANASAAIAGCSIGGGAPDAGAIDLSAMPFWIGAPDSRRALALGAVGNSRPVLGSVFSLRVANVPAGTAIGALVLGLTPQYFDLGSLGMVGCTQLTSVDDSLLFSPNGAAQRIDLQIPAAAAFQGVVVLGQAVTLSPGFTQLGAIASNGGRLQLGL